MKIVSAFVSKCFEAGKKSGFSPTEKLIGDKCSKGGCQK